MPSTIDGTNMPVQFQKITLNDDDDHHRHYDDGYNRCQPACATAIEK